MVAEKELILILMDNSAYMCLRNRYCTYGTCSFTLQLEAIRLYCQAKLKSNPKTAIALRCMGGSLQQPFWLNPTSDLDEILCHISDGRLTKGGDLNFIPALIWSLSYFTNSHPLHHLNLNTPKRMLIFTGGPMTLPPEVAERYGKDCKEMGVAVNFLNFTLNEGSTYHERMIELFVSSANKNGNSHLKHVPPEPSTCISHYLSSPPAIIPRTLIQETAARNKKAEDYKRKNQAAAARNKNAQGYNREIQAAAAAAAAWNKKAQGYNLENQAAAHDDEYVKARGMEPGKHNSLELRNKFKPLSLDNDIHVRG